MTAKVKVLTLLSERQLKQGRFSISFDIVPSKSIDSLKKKRKGEEQVFIDHCSVNGGCSPEFELKLSQDKKCEVTFSVTGALKPQSELEKGEDILEFNKNLDECRRMITLTPTYDKAAEGNAIIKFRVGGMVKHTVTIHDVPKGDTLSPTASSSSFASSQSFTVLEKLGAGRNMSRSESNTSCNSFDPSTSYIDEGSVNSDKGNEMYASATGGSCSADGDVMAEPVFPGSVAEKFGRLSVHDRPGPNVVPPEGLRQETAYDKILCNESLSVLVSSLPPSETNVLLIGLGVPNATLQQNQNNHPGDIVSAHYQSIRFWRTQRKSRKQEHEATNQQLYEDLLYELGDIKRNDIKLVIKGVLDGNRKLERSDFHHL